MGLGTDSVDVLPPDSGVRMRTASSPSRQPTSGPANHLPQPGVTSLSRPLVAATRNRLFGPVTGSGMTELEFGYLREGFQRLSCC
ncbi:unnamed protein product [Protopolystoma xenopodis]|uniref:Uncharacterized protein n=1 Tax=Protopolystoma xenopodis TaxID=117903 RepID=A0A448XNK7_9PLAT|nr:unnamed protein product [Protopolystoma xenopodis]